MVLYPIFLYYNCLIMLMWYYKLEECYISSHCLPFVLLKLMWLLKSSLDQNPTMIYHKFNGDFKSHINFGRTKGGQWDDM
jgi:hypothetical protein